ncbi:MAG: 5'-nucleotidase, lipoprotein e(P4) family [Ferruginibacter sp.]
MKYIIALILSLVSMPLLAQDSLSVQQMDAVTLEYPLLWQQTAAEYRALCYQAFNTASLRLNMMPAKKLRKEKLAIITDLDETILDNSYSDAQLIKEGRQYNNNTWKEWTAKSAATAIPGAVDFLNEAHNKGIAIFYISNRDTADIQNTLTNLKNLQLPNADTAHMLFQTGPSSKEERRKRIMNQYNVIMLLGDNLNDFMDVFEKKTIDGRFTETDKERAAWGNKFIVLPNATYGEWENALYNYQHNLTPQQKEALRRELLKGY